MCKPTLHTAGPNDTTPEHSSYHHYDSDCGWCWLGAAHTEAAHAKQLAEHEQRERDKWQAVANYAGAKLGRTLDPVTLRIRYSDNPSILNPSLFFMGERIAEREGAIK